MVSAIAQLDAPTLQGWPHLQAHLVDGIKRAALRHLHASVAGERLLLRMYLIGEEATELALQRELLGKRPEWLVRQMDQHLMEEQRHAKAFASALRERGEVPAEYQPDWLSQRKIAKWHRLGQQYAANFSKGALVPAFAIGLCAEQMAERVLHRHCAVIGPSHPLYRLLSEILKDEARHVRLCRLTLEMIVEPHEYGALNSLLNDIRAIDRSYGVTGAIGMYLVGLALRFRLHNSPTPA